jgi:hypothetical protein
MTAVGDPTIKHIPRQISSWLLGEIHLGLLIPLMTAVGDPTIKHIPRQISSGLLGEIHLGFWFPLWQLLKILPCSTYPGRWAAGSWVRSLGLLIPLLAAFGDLAIKHIPRQIRSWLLGDIHLGFWFPLWQLLKIREILLV